MANKYDDADGVWRTIGGRRVFIRNGQSLSDAMKESGKFKTKKDDFDEEAYKKRFKSGGDFAFAQENHKTGLEGLEEKDEKESISNLFDVKETENGYEGKGKELLKFIENEEQDSGVEISDTLKDKLRKNPDDTFVFDNENETIVAKGKNNKESSALDPITEEIAKEEDVWSKRKEELLKGESQEAKKDLEDYKKANAEWKAQAQKMEKNYEEFGSNTVDDEKRLNELSRERDIAQSKLTSKEVQDANKDGKYYRDRLLELDSADTPTGTYDIETGEVANFNGKGYNVSFEQTGVQLSDEEYLAKINECRERCDGKVYFGKYGGTPEASFYTEDINEALKIMKENNQKSIYDIANDTEIFNDEYNEATNKIKDLSQTKATETTNNDIGSQIKKSIHNANLGEETKKS